MDFRDFLSEFESLTLCIVPNETKTNFHEFSGLLIGGVNSPRTLSDMKRSDIFLGAGMTNQYRLEVESPQEVIIQILIDQSCKIILNQVTIRHISYVTYVTDESSSANLFKWKIDLGSW